MKQYCVDDDVAYHARDVSRVGQLMQIEGTVYKVTSYTKSSDIDANSPCVVHTSVEIEMSSTEDDNKRVVIYGRLRSGPGCGIGRGGAKWKWDVEEAH